jgi:hypothetical protein
MMGEENEFCFDLEPKEESEEIRKDYDLIAQRLIEEVKKEFKPQPKPRRSLVVSRSKFTGMPIEKQYKKPAMF